MLYDKIVCYDGSLTECEIRNVKEPFSLLEKAKVDQEPFILMSSDIVFDMSADTSYTERSRTNAVSEAGKMLAITEKAVATYENGIVFRVQHTMDEVTKAVLGFVGSGSISMKEQSIRPVAAESVAALGELFVHDQSRWNRRIVHVVVGEVYSVAGMIYGLMREGSVMELAGDPLFWERRADFLGNVMRDVMTPMEMINLAAMNDRIIRREIASWRHTPE